MATIVLVDSNSGKELRRYFVGPGAHVASYPGYSSQPITVSVDDTEITVNLYPRFSML